MYNANNNLSIYLFKEPKDLTIFNPQGFLNFQARHSISSLLYTVAGAMQPKFFPPLDYLCNKRAFVKRNTPRL